LESDLKTEINTSVKMPTEQVPTIEKSTVKDSKSEKPKGHTAANSRVRTKSVVARSAPTEAKLNLDNVKSIASNIQSSVSVLMERSG